MSQEHRLKHPKFHTPESQLLIIGCKINYLLTPLRRELLFYVNGYYVKTLDLQMGLLFTRAVTWIRADNQYGSLMTNDLDLPPQVDACEVLLGFRSPLVWMVVCLFVLSTLRSFQLYVFNC